MPPASQVEWLNQNANRNYPFVEDMGRYPSDGTVLNQDAQLPNFLVVDFVMTMPSAANVRLFLSQIGLVGNLLSFVFRTTDTQQYQVATLTVNLSTHTANQAYDIVGQAAYADARGRIVLGDLSRLKDSLADGLYTFLPTQTLFEACTVRPDLRGLRSLQISSEGVDSDVIYGHVKLVAGTNVRLTYDQTNNAIRIDGISGSGFTEDCQCTNQGQTNIVRTINGIPIEHVWIVGDGEGVEVTTQGNKILIRDRNSEPCCGCPELEFITESLRVLESTIDRLEAFSQQLNDRINTFVTNFVMTVGT